MYIFFKEVKELQKQIKELTEKVAELEKWKSSVTSSNNTNNDNDEYDELFENAKKLVVKEQKVSAAMIQRSLWVGYARAAKIIDQLEEDGIVSRYGGNSPREVLVKNLDSDNDILFKDAKEVVIKHQKASASFLMRRLVIGYARSARILDQLEDAGVIAPSEGSKPRKVLQKNLDSK